MIADLVALVLLSGLLLAMFGWSRPNITLKNLNRREWFILSCLAVSSLLGWLSQLINNDFKSFEAPAPQAQQVKGR